MHYDKPRVRANAGETIKFGVTNVGNVRDEFFIGTVEDSTSTSRRNSCRTCSFTTATRLMLEPSEIGTLVWSFGKPGMVEIGRHIPGHYEAGKKS